MDGQALRMRIKEYMKAHRMAEEGEGVLAAVSGGADSVCLLWVLHELSEELGIHVAAFHLNHGLRGEEADRDEAYVRALCGKLSIPLSVVRENVAEYAAAHGISEEEAGRNLRYFHLERAAGQFCCERIATAHHKDDHAETVLLNMFRGSGLRGLGGIRPVRDTIIRPLLCLTREEIEAYLGEKGVSWCEDSTNGECRYARNKIRNELLPWVGKNINDRAKEHILNAASLASRADEYFSCQAETILSEEAAFSEAAILSGGAVLPGEAVLPGKAVLPEEAVLPKESGVPAKRAGARQKISIRTAVFDKQPDILKEYLVRAMISRVSGSQKDISSRHIEAVCSLKGPGGGYEVMLPYGLKALRGYEALEIRKQEGVSDGEEDHTRVVMRTFSWKKDLEIPKNQYTKWFDYDKIKDTLSVRNRKSGDYFLISGGKRKLLKRFFIDEKIPEEHRESIKLIAEGSHVLWVIGYRISEYYKITNTTRTILEVKICKGEDHG